MIRKSVCPSCQKQREYICTSEIYRGMTLDSIYDSTHPHSLIDSIYNGFYIVFHRIEPRHAALLASEEDMEAAGQRRGFFPGMNPREWKSSGEHLCCVSMHLTRE